MSRVKINLTRQEYDYLLSIFDWNDWNKYEYDKDELRAAIADAEKKTDTVVLQIAVNLKTALLDFIDDKKMEYGFNDAYEVNAAGIQLTLLWDSIYNQTNTPDVEKSDCEDGKA